MKPFLKLVGGLLLLFFGAGHRLDAQISVGATGSAVETFETFPPLAKWGTGSIGLAATEYLTANAVDFAVHIPSFGICLSMNVATSVAVAAYEITGQLVTNFII